MSLLLLSILSISHSWDWVYTPREGICNSTAGLYTYKNAVKNTKFYQITRSNYGDLNYGSCSWVEFQKNDDEFQNFTFYTMFQDGKYYESDFLIEWFTEPGKWGKGIITQTASGDKKPFEILDTDFKTYYIFYSCAQLDDYKKQDYFIIFATNRDFNDYSYRYLAYERGFEDDQLQKTLLDVDYCGEYTIRTN
jgi:hypothetical protein